jgi:hypothetical protein
VNTLGERNVLDQCVILPAFGDASSSSAGRALGDTCRAR